MSQSPDYPSDIWGQGWAAAGGYCRKTATENQARKACGQETKLAAAVVAKWRAYRLGVV